MNRRHFLRSAAIVAVAPALPVVTAATPQVYITEHGIFESDHFADSLRYFQMIGRGTRIPAGVIRIDTIRSINFK
jgi:hypothetical protein